jgi:putative PIN family toxin of toxin-antitoxin system
VIRTVLDTNVLVAAFQFPGGVCDKAFSLCLSGFANLVTSDPLLDEFEGVLREKFGVSVRDARNAKAFVRSVAEVVHPTIVLAEVENDPDDNRILECAVWAEADLIVTGDRAHLQPLRIFRGIPIVSPREFVESLS